MKYLPKIFLLLGECRLTAVVESTMYSHEPLLAAGMKVSVPFSRTSGRHTRQVYALIGIAGAVSSFKIVVSFLHVIHSLQAHGQACEHISSLLGPLVIDRWHHDQDSCLTEFDGFCRQGWCVHWSIVLQGSDQSQRWPDQGARSQESGGQQPHCSCKAL